MVFVLELLLFHIIRLCVSACYVNSILWMETQTAFNKHRRYCLFVWIIRVTACATQHAQEIEPDSWWPPPMANPRPLAASFITASLLPLKRLILPITSKLGPSPHPHHGSPAQTGASIWIGGAEGITQLSHSLENTHGASVYRIWNDVCLLKGFNVR